MITIDKWQKILQPFPGVILDVISSKHFQGDNEKCQTSLCSYRAQQQKIVLLITEDDLIKSLWKLASTRLENKMYVIEKKGMKHKSWIWTFGAEINQTPVINESNFRLMQWQVISFVEKPFTSRNNN